MVAHSHAAVPTLSPWGVIIGVDFWLSSGTMGRNFQSLCMAPLGAEKAEVLVKLLDTALGGHGCMAMGIPTGRSGCP